MFTLSGGTVEGLGQVGAARERRDSAGAGEALEPGEVPGAERPCRELLEAERPRSREVPEQSGPQGTVTVGAPWDS